MRVAVGGFTLVELMVTVVVLMILTTVATPSMVSLIADNRATSVASSLSSAFSLARSEAVVRGQSSAVCSSSNGSSCGGSWNDGWMVFVDEDGNGTHNGSEEILRLWQTPTGEATISATTTAVSYLPLGAAAHASPIELVLSFTPCEGEQQRRITLHPMGRVTVDEEACGT
ncbi:pre-pilin like leader sequence [Ectothiorhodospiraceae bacterium BW-2]|nr:pre-pilin like leader sequence [Ectothiorhodospiraceae bacterium BW-2]